MFARLRMINKPRVYSSAPRARSRWLPLSSQTKCNTLVGGVAMGRRYKQLSLEDRCESARLQAEGCPGRLVAAPASRNLGEQAGEQMLVGAMAVHDGSAPLILIAVLLQPLWARSTHEMAFRPVTLGWFEHWRSPAGIPQRLRLRHVLLRMRLNREQRNLSVVKNNLS